MKVFISWSGHRSQAIACALRDWLPMVLQHVEPWVSKSDISAGERWAQSVAGELETANFGIICVTPENISSEWILFEAGALSKSMQDGKVIPLLYDLDFSDISGPLAQFQAKKLDLPGITEAIDAINKVSKNPAASDIVAKIVPALWGQLEKSISETVPQKETSGKHKRTQSEVLEELVTSVRILESRVRDSDSFANERSKDFGRGSRRFHPMMFEEMFHFVSEDGDDPAGLLMMAGVFRELMPWLSEILVETYRKIEYGTPEQAAKAVAMLRRVIRSTRKSDIFGMSMGGSKEAHMIMMELPHILDRALSRFSDGVLSAPNTDAN